MLTVIFITSMVVLCRWLELNHRKTHYIPKISIMSPKVSQFNISKSIVNVLNSQLKTDGFCVFLTEKAESILPMLLEQVFATYNVENFTVKITRQPMPLKNVLLVFLFRLLENCSDYWLYKTYVKKWYCKIFPYSTDGVYYIIDESKLNILARFEFEGDWYRIKKEFILR